MYSSSVSGIFCSVKLLSLPTVMDVSYHLRICSMYSLIVVGTSPRKLPYIRRSSVFTVRVFASTSRG